MLAPSLLHSAGRGRSARALLPWLLAAACVLGLCAGRPATAAGLSTVEAVVVKFNAGTLPDDAAALPPAIEQALKAALGVQFSTGARTRDGAFTLVFRDAVEVDAARAALNRVRLDPAVLYAGVAPGAPIPDTTGLPTDRLIVKYRDPAMSMVSKAGLPLATAQVDRLTSLAGVPVAWLRGAHDGANVLLMMHRLPIAQVEAIAARIGQEVDVEYAQPDYIRTAQLVPTDPCYASASVAACAGGYQWDLFDPVGGINMPAAWNITTGSAGINVSVIDTGALFNHPDLAGRFVAGYDMISDCAIGNDAQPGPCTWSGVAPNQAPDLASRDADAADPGDWITNAENTGNSPNPPYNWFFGCPPGNSSYHGTHVAGTIGAVPNNGQGIAGINWVSKIVPVRVLGKCGGYDSDIADAMVWAAGGSVPNVPANANPARVLSLSLGGGGSCDVASQNAINTALSLGAVVVVAAGNNNGNAAGFSPASCSGVITVAATIKNGARARYSNYGAMVEIAAPGGNADGVDPDILSTINNGPTNPSANGYNYGRYAGTSMATPHVSGVVSLMLSVNPGLTPSQVISKIQTTARAFPTPGPACNVVPQAAACNCTTSICGAGILDAAAAVVSAQGTGTTLATSANPALSGVTVTFTATVNGNAPTGTVDFKDGANSIAGCSAVALAGAGNARTAQCATSGLGVGAHSITAAYSGDGNNAASASAALSQVISPGVGTTLTSATNPAAAGANVALTATVTTSGNPTGNVNFKDGANSITGCAAVPLSGSGNTKTAVCNTASLTVGTHSLTAVYGGDRSNAGSTSAVLSQVITGSSGPAPTTTTLASAPNPSTVGQNVLFTATVNGVNPTGTVDFKDGANAIAGCAAAPVTGSGNSRTAVCNTTALAQGTHNVTASYGGDAGNAASVSVPVSQAVNAGGPAPTATTLASAPNPSTVGQNVVFTATVNGAGPTGTVNFKDGVASISGCSAVAVTGAGNSRTAVCNTAALGQGAHGVTANYSGDASNAASASAPLTQTVNPPSCIPGRTC